MSELDGGVSVPYMEGFARHHRSLPHDDGIPRSACNQCRSLDEVDRLAGRLTDLDRTLGSFAGLLEAEWYNGNLDESAYERLNADLTGIRAKYIGAIGAAALGESR